MSTMTQTGPVVGGPLPLARRVRNVARLHVANPWPTTGLPWFIFSAIFALNLAIWYIVAGGRRPGEP